MNWYDLVQGCESNDKPFYVSRPAISHQIPVGRRKCAKMAA